MLGFCKISYHQVLEMFLRHRALNKRSVLPDQYVECSHWRYKVFVLDALFGYILLEHRIVSKQKVSSKLNFASNDILLQIIFGANVLILFIKTYLFELRCRLQFAGCI